MLSADVAVATTDVEHNDGGLRTTAAPEMVALNLSARPRAPRLQLLLEQEPAYRVFLRNFTDLIFSRTPPPIAVTSTPETSWNDVFVPSSMPWRRFVESLLGHMIVVTALLILVPKWPSGPIERPRVFDKSYVSYYTPPNLSQHCGVTRHGRRLTGSRSRRAAPQYEWRRSKLENLARMAARARL